MRSTLCISSDVSHVVAAVLVLFLRGTTPPVVFLERKHRLSMADAQNIVPKLVQWYNTLPQPDDDDEIVHLTSRVAQKTMCAATPVAPRVFCILVWPHAAIFGNVRTPLDANWGPYYGPQIGPDARNPVNAGPRFRPHFWTGCALFLIPAMLAV